MTEQPAQPQMPPREPYNIRHARHMAERAAAEDARRARHGRPPKGTADHAGTCLIFGILLGLAGAIGPRIPGYLVSQSGVRWSVASYHEACTSGFGELAQAGHPGVSSACSQASLWLAVGWVVLVAGVILAAAGVALWVRQRPAS